MAGGLALSACGPHPARRARSMRLQIVHRTRYRYSAPVSENFNEVRLQPVSDERQECHRFVLTTVPAAPVRRYHDLHLNLVDHFYLADSHAELRIEARSEVTTQAAPGVLETASFPLARIGECSRLERCFDFLQMSEYVGLDVEVWRQAMDMAAGLEDAWQVARAMSRAIHHQFTYDTAATTANTHMLDVLRFRRGVCQDFAHVLIGLCRSLRIPARYVSGYLFVGEEAGWRGNLASHAWVEVFLPGFGWLPIDPTNERPVGEHHVKVAVGRDYADAAPVRGNFKGRASQEMAVELDIRPVPGP